MLLVAALLQSAYLLSEEMQAHRWVQTKAALINGILVLWLMILPFRDFIIRDQGGPRPSIFYAITIIHALIGAIAFPFGIFVVLRGNNLVPKFLRFKNYKLFMRTAYVLYILATLAGVFVYITWFVIIPNTPIY
jgi:uncharacterized membrane protein YozB (DUF420 family)